MRFTAESVPEDERGALLVMSGQTTSQRISERNSWDVELPQVPQSTRGRYVVIEGPNPVSQFTSRGSSAVEHLEILSQPSETALPTTKEFARMAGEGHFVNLTSLKLRDVELLSSACQAFRDATRDNKLSRLDTLEFVGCRIGDAEAKKLRVAVKNLPSLCDLRIEHGEVGDVMMASLLSSFKNMPHLNTLVLHGKDLGEVTEEKVRNLLFDDGKAVYRQLELLDVCGFKDPERERKVQRMCAGEMDDVGSPRKKGKVVGVLSVRDSE